MRETTNIKITKKLKISDATVSQALNEYPYIKDETKIRVKKLAKN